MRCTARELQRRFVDEFAFSDDILLAGRSLYQEVKEMLADLMRECGKLGLAIHPWKTKILNNGLCHAQDQTSVEVDGAHIHYLRARRQHHVFGKVVESM